MAAPLHSLSKTPSFSRLSSIPTYSALPQRSSPIGLPKTYSYQQQPPFSPTTALLSSYIPTYSHPSLTTPLPSIQLAAPRPQEASSWKTRFFSKASTKTHTQIQTQTGRVVCEQLPSAQELEFFKQALRVPQGVPTTIIDIALNASPAVNMGQKKPWGFIFEGLNLSMSKLRLGNLKELSREKRQILAAELKDFVGPEYEHECVLFIQEIFRY